MIEEIQGLSHKKNNKQRIVRKSLSFSFTVTNKYMLLVVDCPGWGFLETDCCCNVKSSSGKLLLVVPMDLLSVDVCLAFSGHVLSLSRAVSLKFNNILECTKQ